MNRIVFVLVLMVSALVFSCKKELKPFGEELSSPSLSEKMNPAGEELLHFYALGDDNRLDEFSVGATARLIRSLTAVGLQNGERLLSIDFRPATGQLYALGSTSRMYVINLNTGKATAVGTGPFMPPLSGVSASLDFNPTVDRIRVVTSTGQNLRLHPETGRVVMEDGMINGSPGAEITAVAYTNNFAGTATTTLYDIDVANDMLYKQDPPNNGTLVAVGRLNANLQGEGGFDISPPATDGSASTTALALYRQNKKSTLYSIDLNTGRARPVEKFDKGDLYYGLAIPTNPVAYAVNMSNLLIFDPTVSASTTSRPITGLQAGESIIGIDFRPLTGALYALGSNSRLYTINTSTGAASFVAGLSVALAGESFGFDFNPVPDRIRIISNTGQNLRVNPDDGVAINDGAINPVPASVTAAAYTNSFPGTTTTSLYVIDAVADRLYLQNPPNNGTLTNGQILGFNVDAGNGFDIGGTSNMAYGLFTSGGQTKLYRVDLANGKAAPLGDFIGMVNGFAIGPGF